MSRYLFCGTNRMAPPSSDSETLVLRGAVLCVGGFLATALAWSVPLGAYLGTALALGGPLAFVVGLVMWVGGVFSSTGTTKPRE